MSDDVTAHVLACEDSLQRSRSRRRRLALAVERVARRRRRRSTGVVAALGIAVAAVSPLAVAHRTSSTKAPASEAAAVQRALGVAPTGVYDAKTRRAVRAFQRRNGLVVDGIVGPQTRGALGLGASRKARTRSVAEGPSGTLDRIATCESGGNPRAVSPDGRYRGKYQFTRATWRSLGGTGDPAAAPESTQDALAAKLLARRGTSPWPSCA